MMNLYQRIPWGLVLFLLPFVLHAQSKDNIRKHTEFLASDELEGRGTGSRGIRLAANYIAAQFNAIGLQKINGNSFYQKFPFPGQAEMESNIVGFIEARTPSTKSVVFVAHYDGLGIQKEAGQTDTIYNGALDNAVGVGALLELARIFKNAGAPKHNLVFVATAGEEFGRHGSQFYVDHPIFPNADTIICLNIDGFNVSGPREDFFIFPRQGVDFVDEIETLLTPLGWHYISPDWVDDLNASFDTASFLSKGIPALTLWIGNRLKGGEIAEPLDLGGIHTPQDEINDHWNWDGVEDHLGLYKRIADYFLEHPDGIEVTDPSLFMEQ
ncbi:M28 family peptidase [Ulvibacterium sp.]|uniref:M28 family peptidase n=1 Tax=Ulvibacterium sp. TaxID=2665914 RepID=UPI002612FDF2|nr:M28 family peptidase [Ulvibacterium sp.]